MIACFCRQMAAERRKFCTAAAARCALMAAGTDGYGWVRISTDDYGEFVPPRKPAWSKMRIVCLSTQPRPHNSQELARLTPKHASPTHKSLHVSTHKTTFAQHARACTSLHSTTPAQLTRACPSLHQNTPLFLKKDEGVRGRRKKLFFP